MKGRMYLIVDDKVRLKFWVDSHGTINCGDYMEWIPDDEPEHVTIAIWEMKMMVAYMPAAHYEVFQRALDAMGRLCTKTYAASYEITETWEERPKQWCYTENMLGEMVWMQK